jgi:stage V sporulation protein D (sporulation-specific penicillin-binding protein)
MMQIAERVGASDFYSYVDAFGYLGKSGIDLPSEAASIFHDKEAIGPTELATISFGQRFKVSVINHLRAICAVANGGELVTPYVVKSIIAEDGRVIFERDTEPERRVISAEVASTVSKILADGVSGDGGAKNARVEGYVIAAKTGTSEKFDVLDENGNSYLRIASTVAYNVSEDGGIATIIVVDEPQGSVKYGSVVAAPYVSALLGEILPYLGYRSDKVTDEIAVPDLVGRTVKSAKEELDGLDLKYEIVGDGDIVLSQSPTHHDTINNTDTTVILYTTDECELITVPSFIGREISEAVKECAEIGLNIRLCGSKDGGTVVSQSLPMGAKVKKGSVIELRALISDYED